MKQKIEKERRDGELASYGERDRKKERNMF